VTPEPVTFDDEFGRETGEMSTSWERARPRSALIERQNRYGWRVLLPDGDHAHHVFLARDGDQYIGRCHTYADGALRSCKGFKYGDGPCAHLCTIRKAAFGNIRDDTGDVVTIHDRDPDLDVAPDHDHRAIADGGIHR
jgi:hypothetical protein